MPAAERPWRNLFSQMVFRFEAAFVTALAASLVTSGLVQAERTRERPGGPERAVVTATLRGSLPRSAWILVRSRYRVQSLGMQVLNQADGIGSETISGSR